MIIFKNLFNFILLLEIYFIYLYHQINNNEL